MTSSGQQKKTEPTEFTVKNKSDYDEFRGLCNKNQDYKLTIAWSDIEYVYLRDCENLKEIKFPKELQQLESLDLSFTGITKLEGLENISQLRHLYLSYTGIKTLE